MGIAPARMRDNLDAILDALAARAIPAMICGMRAPPWLGAYTPACDAVFEAAARDRGVLLYPFLLDGVALDPAYVLPDRIHPNAAGVERIARRIDPFVADRLGGLSRSDRPFGHRTPHDTSG